MLRNIGNFAISETYETSLKKALCTIHWKYQITVVYRDLLGNVCNGHQLILSDGSVDLSERLVSTEREF